ncbi:hypothetical protein EMMF5_000515 [Cystobasidiomycetes sp. EMM_F5]
MSAHRDYELEDKPSAAELEQSPTPDTANVGDKDLIEHPDLAVRAHIDKEEERKLTRRIDLYLMPIAYLCYLITFIDRTNIGNARSAGLNTDLGLVGFQYNIGLTVFYLFYGSWEIVSNIMCKLIGAGNWIPLQIFAFGVVSLATGFIQNFGGFLGVRIALGLAEGGVLPALALVLSRFYKRQELVFRIAILLSCSSLSGAFGGLLASGFLGIGKVGNIGNPWRNIFIFEGVITCVISIIAYLIIPSTIEGAKWLSQEQKNLAVLRIQHESSARLILKDESAKKGAVQRQFKSLSMWLCGLGFACNNVAVQGLSLFLPLVVKGIYPTLDTVPLQLRTVPPYAVGFIWGLSVAYMSDRFDRRGLFLLCTVPMGLIGYIILIATNTTMYSARYAALFLIVVAMFPVGPFFLAWGLNNCATDNERAVAGGFIPGFGSAGSIIATWVYLPDDAPAYPIGNRINLVFVILVISFSAITMFYCLWENRQRKAGKRDHRLEGYTKEELDAGVLGYHHPDFRYSW